MNKILTFTLLFTAFLAVGQKSKTKDYLITMETSMGTMQLVLFDETPLHKANFLKLAKGKFYDGLLFHRVKDKFMIQGGDPNSKDAEPGTRLGAGGSDMEKIPFEFVPEHVHIKGALAAARDNNPKKMSSASQFYIVTGKVIKPSEMVSFGKRSKMVYNNEQLEKYSSIGGAPFLDNNYTVYGQVIKGIEIAEAIQKVKKDRADRPLENVSMKVRAKRMSRKKITKKFGYNY